MAQYDGLFGPTYQEWGWVMVARDNDQIIDYTFRPLRRDAIKSLCDLLPHWSRRKVLRLWKPCKAEMMIMVDRKDVPNG